MTDSFTLVEGESKAEAIARSMRAVFGVAGARNNEQQLVYAWLQEFCRAHKPTYSDNEREHCVREGRREVFLMVDDAVRTRTYTVAEILGADNPKPNEEVSQNEF